MCVLGITDRVTSLSSCLVVQLELWSTLGAIFKQSLSNIHTCRSLGLIEHCLEHLTKTRNSRVAGQCTSPVPHVVIKQGARNTMCYL